MKSLKKSQVGFIYAALVLGHAVLFSIWQVEPVPLFVHASGIFLWAISIFPIAHWYCYKSRSAPMFEIICLAYGLAYSIPIYLAPNTIITLSREVSFGWNITFESVLLAAFGLATLISAYYVTLRVTRSIGLPQLNLRLPVKRQSSYISFALLVGLGMQIVTSTYSFGGTSYGAVLHLLESQAYVGLILLAYLEFSVDIRRTGRRMLLWGYTVVITLLGLSTGQIETALVPMILVFIVHWHKRQRFPVVHALFMGTFLLIFNPIKAEYRNLTWFSDSGGGNPVERLSMWVQAARNVASDQRVRSPEENDARGLFSVVQRVDLLHKFMYVRSMTPSEVPYLGGESYRYMLFTYIPRVLWPDKPMATEATDLVDYAYGFRSPFVESNGTNIAIGQLAEAFANFGWIGIIGVMLMQGMIFALLEKILNGVHSVGGRAIYLSVMVFFLNGIGTSAVILFGFIPQFVIASALLLRPFAVRDRLAGVTPGRSPSRANELSLLLLKRRSPIEISINK